MAEFTKAQQAAIDETGKTLLVSAAAGSGKTTTLIERILRSVVRRENPVMLDRLLVVTFTKPAASELRLRISRAISEAIAEDGENEMLIKQFALLSSAKISTIDSFCLSLVRANYATLGLSPSFRIADEGEAALLANETMEMLINECYDSEDGTLCGGARGFARLVDTIVGSSDDRRLADTMLSLYEKLAAYPKGAAALCDCEGELRRYAEGDFFECPHGMRVQKYIAEFFEYYRRGYLHALSLIRQSEALANSYEEIFEEDLHGIFKIEEALGRGYAEGREAILSTAFSRLKVYRGEKTDDVMLVKALRDDYKKKLTTVIFPYVTSSGADIANSLIKTADICNLLAGFLLEYERRAEAEKKRLCLCDFSDLSRYALRLLVDKDGNDTPLAASQKELYDAVYIDEYQDVNAVQDRIFSAISKPCNRFMVGDIKQSIYAFRGAEPAVFEGLRNSYPEYKKGEAGDSAAIFMSENFRCGREIIDFTNMIFDRLMPLVSPEMHYKESDSLVFKKKCERNAPLPVNIVLAKKPPKDTPEENINTELHYIAREICRLVKTETKDNGERISYGDIAILMRSPKAKTDELREVLTSYGIPVYAETNADLLRQSEVEIVMCMLEAIDNPRRDISLAGILMSPLYGISFDFIAGLRSGKGGERLFTTVKKYIEDGEDTAERELLRGFAAELYEFRSMARYMSAGELIDELYSRHAVSARLSAASPLRRANLELLRRTAYGFSGGACSLSEFLRYIKNIEANGTKPIAAARGGVNTSDAVTVMSVHKSKGLEFPVVFLADTLRSYNLDDAYKPILYHGGVGFAMKLRDDTGFGVYDTMLRKSAALAITRSAKEEELRLLYVALTRARERLYMTAMCQFPAKLINEAKSESSFLCVHSAVKLTSFMQLALLAAGGKDSEFLKISEYEYIREKEAVPDIVGAEKSEDTELSPEEEMLLCRRFDYSYPHAARTKIPTKLALSRLYPDILDDRITEESAAEDILPRAKEAPQFISHEENTAARKGTATHLFMQFFDFENAANNGAERELSCLVEKRFISEEDAALVRLDEVEKFLSSPLFADMRGARRLYREQRFNLPFDAADFATDERLKTELLGETVLVQGVIDCFFENADGDIILVDYKTDRVSKGDRAAAEARLREAHAAQLGYYARAIKEICGRAPKHVYIYSLCLGDTVSV